MTDVARDPERLRNVSVFVVRVCRDPYTHRQRKEGLRMRSSWLLVSCLIATGAAHAVDCSTAGPTRAAPLRPTVLSPIAQELVPLSYQLGGAGSVLTQAYDEAQSLDQVLLRLRVEGCQDVAKAMPAPSAINPNDPAAYKPQTAFDNTPWRFDMSQNGKRMTADEFSAWMKSRGVRVAKGAAPVAIPAAAEGDPAAVTSAPAAGNAPTTVPTTVTPVPAKKATPALK